MSTISELDPTQKPPQALRAAHKFYQRVSQDALAKDDNVLDLAKVQRNAGDPRLSLVMQLKRSNLAKVFTSFENLPRNGECEAFDDIKVYEHRELSGKSLGDSIEKSTTLTCQAFSSYPLFSLHARKEYYFRVCCTEIFPARATKRTSIFTTAFHMIVYPPLVVVVRGAWRTLKPYLSSISLLILHSHFLLPTLKITSP